MVCLSKKSGYGIKLFATKDEEQDLLFQHLFRYISQGCDSQSCETQSCE